MQMDYMRITQKPTDYKVCEECGHLNWYENEQCCNCDCKEFDSEERLVVLTIEDDYSFYKQEGYTESEIDNMYIDV